MISKILHFLSFIFVFYADYKLFAKVRDGNSVKIGQFLRPDSNFQLLLGTFVSFPFVTYLVVTEIAKVFGVLKMRKLGNLTGFLLASIMIFQFSLLSLENSKVDWNTIFTLSIIFTTSQVVCIIGQIFLIRFNFPAFLYPGQIFSITSCFYLIYYAWKSF